MLQTSHCFPNLTQDGKKYQRIFLLEKKKICVANIHDNTSQPNIIMYALPHTTASIAFYALLNPLPLPSSHKKNTYVYTSNYDLIQYG